MTYLPDREALDRLRERIGGGTLVTVRLPLDRDDVSGKSGVDQLVCTVLAVHQQAGGPTSTKERFTFAHGAAVGPRPCPVLPTE